MVIAMKRILSAARRAAAFGFSVIIAGAWAHL
jgi:hypothetical protein